MDLRKLKEPFPAEEIEWRLAQCGKTARGFWGKCLAYVTNRAIMNRLDDVCGPENWKNEFAKGPEGGVACGLSILIPRGLIHANGDSRQNHEWVTKWDGAENTQVEAIKGGLSDAMKRAAVQWGIGRYLYDLEEGFARIVGDDDKGAFRGQTKERETFRWRPPELPSWALPTVAGNATKAKPVKDSTTIKAEAMQDYLAVIKAADAERKSKGVCRPDKTVVAEAIALRGWKIDGFASWSELQESLGVEKFRKLTKAIDLNPTAFEKETHREEDA